MTTELKIQANMVFDLKRADGFGYKQSNKFLAGPPDLYLSHPSTGPVYIEVKLNDPSSKLVNVTPLQEETIKRMQASGSKCAIVVVVPLSGVVGGYDIFVTTDPTKKRLDDDWIILHKPRGENWPMLAMMSVCDTVPHR